MKGMTKTEISTPASGHRKSGDILRDEAVALALRIHGQGDHEVYVFSVGKHFERQK